MGSVYGEGSGPIWLTSLQCQGDEENVTDCRHDDWGATDCQHSDDVSISCGQPQFGTSVY